MQSTDQVTLPLLELYYHKGKAKHSAPEEISPMVLTMMESEEFRSARVEKDLASLIHILDLA